MTTSTPFRFHPPSAGQAGRGRFRVTAEQFSQLALSRRKLTREFRGADQVLIDEESGESYWVEEARVWGLAARR